MKPRRALFVCLLLGACSATPNGLPVDEKARRDHWKEQVLGVFACRSLTDLDVFLNGIRRLPPRRPRNSGGGSYQYHDQPVVHDDLFPLDEDFDLYLVWNAEDPGMGIRSIEVVGFSDLRDRIPPGYFEALRALNRSSDGNQVELIRSANQLISLGNRARDALQAYVELARRLPFGEARKHSVDVSVVAPTVQLLSAAPNPVASVKSDGLEHRPLPWPTFLLEQEVPFQVVLPGPLSGRFGKIANELGPDFSLRDGPLVPTANPVDAVESLTSSSRWAALLRGEPDSNAVELKKSVRRQALIALAAVYQPPEDYLPKSCCGDPAEAFWRQIVKEVRALDLRWDPQAQDFVRSR